MRGERENYWISSSALRKHGHRTYVNIYHRHASHVHVSCISQALYTHIHTHRGGEKAHDARCCDLFQKEVFYSLKSTVKNQKYSSYLLQSIVCFALVLNEINGVITYKIIYQLIRIKGSTDVPVRQNVFIEIVIQFDY